MPVLNDARAVMRVIRRAVRRRRRRHELERQLAARVPLPGDFFDILIYFADRPMNLYQIRQWYQPMRELAKTHHVAVVSRSTTTALTLLQECPLPVFYGPTIAGVEEFLSTQPVKLVFYVNQNMRNFQMMRFPNMFHVHISHGESEKISMSSNQLKMYDYAFVAGDAAVDRITARLLDFDSGKRLIPIGRPQVDVEWPRPDLPNDGRVLVLYAPTWEGDRPSMSYSSLTSHGVSVITALLATGRHRIIYRPHPRTGVFDPSYREAGAQIVALVEAANRQDPTAHHMIDTETAFGWHLRTADVCICDVSAVAFDWLATGKPLLVTEPAAQGADVDRSGIVGSVPLLPAGRSGEVVAMLDDLATGEAGGDYRALVQRYFGDTTPGASMKRFLEASEFVIEARDRAVQARGTGDDATAVSPDDDIEEPISKD